MPGWITWDYLCSNPACAYLAEAVLVERDQPHELMACLVCGCEARKCPGGVPLTKVIPSASSEARRFQDIKERRKLERQSKRLLYKGRAGRVERAEVKREIKKLGGGD